jgi:hypothetical protein
MEDMLASDWGIVPLSRGSTSASGAGLALRVFVGTCLVLGAIGLSGCGTSSKSAASLSGPAKYSPPAPIDIKVVADEKLAKTEVIGSEGGAVAAKGADGTVFTLTFPKGAVRGSEKITLTPAKSADGLPFSGGLAGAVQMSPEGLRLLAPAVLRIESPKTVSAKGFETVAFAYHKEGEGLYLNPGEAKDGAMTLEVWHFSGAGAAQATQAEINTQQTQHVPSVAEDAFTQRVREYIGKQRDAEMLGEKADPEFWNAMNDYLEEAYNSFVGPELPVALKDCDKAHAIMSKALEWARNTQMMVGTDTPKGKKLLALSEDVMGTYEKVKKKCWQGYTATGTFGEGAFTGSVPSLEKPFTLTIVAPGAETRLAFTPTGPEAGTFKINGHAQGGAVFTGSGTYTVKDAGTESPTLITNDAGTTTAPGRTFSWGHNVPIQLVPTE